MRIVKGLFGKQKAFPNTPEGSNNNPHKLMEAAKARGFREANRAFDEKNSAFTERIPFGDPYYDKYERVHPGLGQSYHDSASNQMGARWEKHHGENGSMEYPRKRNPMESGR